MPYRLRFTSGKSKGSTFALEEGRVLTVGRSPSNDICIPDTKISRIHCQVELAGRKCNLTDLNSSNGTYVDGKRVDEFVLDDGGAFHLGFTTVLFEGYGEEDAAAVGGGKGSSDEHPRIMLCSECGRAVVEADLRRGDAREIGSGVYCSVCAGEFADVELVEEEPRARDEGPDDEAEAKLMDTHPSIDPLAGQTVAGCEIVEMIAEGPMGKVYRAKQLSMDRMVALRLLARGPETTDEILEQMIGRARLSGIVSHPHVVAIYDLGQDGNLYYVTMELVAGDSVRELLLKHKRLMVPDALYIACHVARALHHALQQNLVHGDVHPGNILVDRSGHARLTDFGPVPEAMLARMQPGRQLAYLRYTAPERLEGRKLDITSDIYSLGATLYHLICGVPPIDAEDVAGMRDLLMRQDVAPPSTVNEEVPRNVDEVLMKMLAKSPKERYDNPGALSRKLRSMVRALRSENSGR